MQTHPPARCSPSRCGRRPWGRALLTLALFAACASSPPEDEEVPSAEGYYQRAVELLEGRRTLLFFRDVNYPRAIELFQEVIDNYPYSDYATLSELKIADIQFDRGNYLEAAGYYQDFVELHPTHAEVPYALYRHGLCAYAQINEADRDQSSTHDAIEQFQALIERYPDSEYADDARARLQDASDMLARHDVEVGDFYLGRGECHAAARRYRQALSAYPDHSDYRRTMYQLANALVCARRIDDAIVIYHQILEEDPEGDLAGNVRDRLEDLGLPPPKRNGAGA
jgi:outer membrane protein assembly factor BamD